VTLTEQEFRLRADEALDRAHHALAELADTEDFELELQNGVLALEFEEPERTKFVVSPNAPMRQIWVSAMSKSHKLSWGPSGGFTLDGEDLTELLVRMTREFLHR